MREVSGLDNRTLSPQTVLRWYNKLQSITLQLIVMYYYTGTINYKVVIKIKAVQNVSSVCN